MNYEATDLEQYDEYMNYIYSYIKDSGLPKRTQNKMLNGSQIKVMNGETWFISYTLNRTKKNIYFNSFSVWLKQKTIQENRIKKLDELGI